MRRRLVRKINWCFEGSSSLFILFLSCQWLQAIVPSAQKKKTEARRRKKKEESAVPLQLTYTIMCFYGSMHNSVCMCRCFFVCLWTHVGGRGVRGMCMLSSPHSPVVLQQDSPLSHNTNKYMAATFSGTVLHHMITWCHQHDEDWPVANRRLWHH